MAPRGRTRSAASRYFCAHGGLPSPRTGHLRYPRRFRHSHAARSVDSRLTVLPAGRIPDRILGSIAVCFGATFPVPSFRSKTVRQPIWNDGNPTDFGDKCHKMKGIPLIDGELFWG